MRTFIGPNIILSDLTEGPTLFAQSDVKNVNNEYMHITMIRIAYKCIMDGIRLVLCDLI